MNNLDTDLYQLERGIKKLIESFENNNKLSVDRIKYKSYTYDSNSDSLVSKLGREVSVSVKRKIS
jgi:hypothetical protein